MKKGILPLIFLILLMFSCQGRVTRLEFETPGGNIPLNEKPGRKVEMEGTLFSVKNGVSTPLYRLRKSAAVTDNADAFFLRYRILAKSAVLSLRVKGNKVSLSYPLPYTDGGAVEIRIPLKEEEVVTAFSVSSPDPIGDGEIDGAGLAVRMPGMDFTGEYLLTGPDLKYSRKLTKDMETFLFDLPEFWKETLKIEYTRLTGKDFALVTARNTKTKEEKKIRLLAVPGEHSLYLRKGLLGFYPDQIQIDSTSGNLRLARIVPVMEGSYSSTLPLPADFSAVLEYDRTYWRNPQWEVFAWSARASVLIFDTLDYKVQAGFFKRIAFFVEKNGYIGKLLTEEQLKDKHGWNAHDYQGRDLARFFNKAAEVNFPLNEYERILEEILISTGVLKGDFGNYEAGEGAVIGISRESPPYLRRKFIVHEGLHGLFFTDQAFREESTALWEFLNGAERRYWDNFFTWMAYGEDPYLRANEYQAYLLQQPVSSAEYYFRNHGALKWMEASGNDEDILLFLTRNPETFTNQAGAAEEFLIKNTGFEAGSLFSWEYAK